MDKDFAFVSRGQFNAGTLQITDKPQPINMSNHWGMMIWNDGSNSIYCATNGNANGAETWKAGDVASYDNMEDRIIWVSCASSLTTTARVQFWGTPAVSLFSQLFERVTDVLISILKKLGGLR